MSDLLKPLRRLRERTGGSGASGPDPQDPMVWATAPDRKIIEHALPYTMTGVPRLQSLIDAVRHVAAQSVPGDFVECGVWRGGSVVAMIQTLQEVGDLSRHIWLYDTFEGMTEPSEHDVSPIDGSALAAWRDAQAKGERAWSDLFSAQSYSEEQVRRTVLATDYPAEQVHFVRGAVEATLPDAIPPGQVALLRLDTDWYESTLHELQHLYPLLASGGILIIDDYGHFEGARRAVDEFFDGRTRPLLNRIDYTARIGVKP